MGVHEDTLQGLQDMLEYVKGDKSKGRSKVVSVPNVIPLREYSKEEIKRIRTEHQMTQRIFAEIVGVSPKTVEAWETGTNRPTGSAMRVMQLIETDEKVLDHMLVQV